MSRPYLETLNSVAKDHGLHVGLKRHKHYWLLFVTRPGSTAPVNELVAKDLHGGLDAAAHILRSWIESDHEEGAKR